MSSAVRPLSLYRSTRSFIPLPTCRARSKSGAICGNHFLRRNFRTTESNASIATEPANNDLNSPIDLLSLPKTCPGCGAYAQNTQHGEPGFFSVDRKAVQYFIGQEERLLARADHDEAETISTALKNADQSLQQILGLPNQNGISRPSKASSEISASGHTLDNRAPVCDRCHGLRHHNTAASIAHPTLESLRNTIAESPSKYNHIFHVIDAADFPLSVIPSLQHYLSLSPQRSLNRRSKKIHYQHGTTSEISYIITRSDLLAPRKEQVDTVMPYIVDVLRTTLGRSAENVRFGNVHCVSSKRGWWTKDVKEDLFHRGGMNWMVGKVNVGKSNLFETVFPKGHTQDLQLDRLQGKRRGSSQSDSAYPHTSNAQDSIRSNEGLTEPSEGMLESLIMPNSLLPPMPKETPFPMMPLVSSSPGTTASPIRLSFGNRKGELVDLPGLNRGGLEPFVIEGHKHDLVMLNRIKPKQFIVKTGQALLIGGLVQITPVTPDTTILAYPFVPLQSRVLSAEKARSVLMGQKTSDLESIARPGIGTRMQTAGTYPLKWDVTKARAGPLTAKAGVGLKTTVLPFVVLSTDILIEGCGWIELVAQVRKKNFLDSEVAQTKSFFDDKMYPLVEIMSPDGRHVGYRRPMGAWLLGGEKPKTSGRRTKPPRRSMKGAKKMAKRANRLVTQRDNK